jgi:hypothetical protein
VELKTGNSNILQKGNKMAKSVLSKIGRTSKRAVIGVIRGTGDIAGSVLEATKDVLLVTVDMV